MQQAWCGYTVAFCASLAWVLVRAGLVPAVSDMTWTVWQTSFRKLLSACKWAL